MQRTIFALLLAGGLAVFGLRAARPTIAHEAVQVAWPTIFLTPVISSLQQPVHVTHAGDGSGRLFVVERAGYVRLFKDEALLGTPFLDITDRVQDDGPEEGLLSVAFPPGFGASVNHFYVYYVNNSGDLNISRFAVSAGDPDSGDPNSEQIILTIPHPVNANHDGGQLMFGPNDGYLYIGPGDGGGGGDPGENAQDPNELLGKLLRLDVETGSPLTYTIPTTNPYTQTAGYRGEIWALGLRNPWRFSFDRQTADLYIADVGQQEWEEINFQPASSAGGENYGWDCYEGNHDFELGGCGASGVYTFPVHEYFHDDTICAVIGGFVYRGSAAAFMQGLYFFGDSCGGQIWGLQPDGTGWQSSPLLDTMLGITSFGEDEAGNLYAADGIDGVIYRVDSLENHLHLPLIVK